MTATLPALRDCLNVYAPGTTFEDILWDCSNPFDDCVSWHIAVEAAEMHSLISEFWATYGPLQDERIDCGELLEWLGY
jgi:hypothetical protein